MDFCSLYAGGAGGGLPWRSWRKSSAWASGQYRATSHLWKYSDRSNERQVTIRCTDKTEILSSIRAAASGNLINRTTDRKDGRRPVWGVEPKRAKKTYFIEQDKRRDSLCSLAHNLRESGIPASVYWRVNFIACKIAVLSRILCVLVGKTKIYSTSLISEFKRGYGLTAAALQYDMEVICIWEFTGTIR